MPILILFGVVVGVTGALGYILWDESHRRVQARYGRPLPHPGSPDSPVDIAFLGDRAVVKVYYENNAYSPHVYWRDEFLDSSGGFGSVPPAVGWGRGVARDHGADV